MFALVSFLGYSAFVAGNTELALAIAIVGILAALIIGLFQAALHGIVSAALYRYATLGSSDDGIPAEALSHAFAPK
jgi:flagellar biosynthesis component FlhA